MAREEVVKEKQYKHSVVIFMRMSIMDLSSGGSSTALLATPSILHILTNNNFSDSTTAKTHDQSFEVWNHTSPKSVQRLSGPNRREATVPL